ncbi:MAG TPA: TolC family protein [Candidatus Omnitrophota bacterium]|nr:TolC family protein [Candidatus Omnitrophota bacterium]
MRLMKMVICIQMVSCIFVQPIFANEIGFDALSLNDALRIAYINHPRMQEAKQEISAAKGAWIQAEALPDPEFSLDVGGLKKHAKVEDEADSNQIRKGNIDAFSIKQPLDPLGTRFLRGSVARDNVKISKGSLQLAWAEVRKQVIEVYSRILAQEKAHEIAQENLKATRQFFTQVETKFQAGNALQSDSLRARIEVSRAENDLLIAQKNLKVSKGELNLALGRSVESSFSLKDSLAYDSLRYEYEKIRESAIVQRADVGNEKTLLRSKKKELWSAILKTFFPKMSIGVERVTTDFDNDTAILLEASYPLWGFNWGAIKEAKANKEKQNVRFEALKRQVGLEVYQAFLEAELADKQVLLQKKAIEEANELLRQVTLQYETGEVQFLTYLENIKTIKETRLAYFTALKDYKEKVAELERVIQATPTPGKEKI